MTTSRSAAPVQRRWLMAGIVLAVIGAYWGSLHGALVFDDGPGIVTNPTLRHPGELGRLLFPPGDQAGTVGGRPLLNLSFALNYALGGTQVRGYHVFNLLIHAVAALLLFGIVRRTPWAGPRAVSRDRFAAAVALIWALHPLNTQAVTYVIQRAESMMGLFYLLTLYCFLRGASLSSPTSSDGLVAEASRAFGNKPGFRPKALEASATQATGRGWTGERNLWLCSSVLSCFCGAATKEVMVSAPLIVLLYDRTFLTGSFAAVWRARRGYYLALASSWILLALLVASTHGRGGSAGFNSSAGMWPYALTQCRAIVTYLRLAVWPSPLIFDYGTALASRPLQILPQIIVLAALLAATIWALVRRPALGFLGAWFFAILAPSSSFVPIATEPIAEQRMYLPLAAVVVAILAAADAAWARKPRLLFTIAGAAAAALLGALTIQRNRDYRTEIALWTDTAAKLPDNARAHNDLGTALKARGDLAAAAAEFAAAARVQPDYAPAQFNLGVLLLDARRPAEALPYLQHAQAAPRYQAELQLYLAQAFVATGRYREAAGAYRRAVAQAPARADLHNDLANALLMSGQPTEAAAEYRAALRLRPGDRAIEANLAAAMSAAP